MSVIVVADEPFGSQIVEKLAQEGTEVEALARPDDLLRAVSDRSAPIRETLRDATVIVLHATRAVLIPDVVALCDRSGTRIVPVCDRAADKRAARAFGLAVPIPTDSDAAALKAAVERPSFDSDDSDGHTRGSVTVVWGPHGAPGRTTVATALASALALSGQRVAVIDADTHAAAVAQRLGLPDEAPGFPAACRQTDYGVLDAAELTRLSEPLRMGEHTLEVLTGINRPSRWPELSAARVAGALDVARDWVDHVVVDVAASLDADEEITSDVSGPRRNQAAFAALAAADRVIAVGAPDPVGISRLLRGWARLDEVAAHTPRICVINRVRRSVVGVDAAGQLSRTVGAFTDADGMWLLPDDPRSADRALLESKPMLPGRRAALAREVGRLAATL